MKRAEITLLIVLAAFAASLSLGATGLNYSDRYSFGPGFVPLNIGLLLLACCALQGLRMVRRARAEGTPAGSDPGADPQAGPDIAGLLSAAAIIGLGIAAMSLGSVLAPIAAIVLLLSWRVARHSLAISAFVSLATTATIFVIFSVWLGLPVT